MKTKLLTTALAAFALVGALVPDRVEAYVSPTWDQVGYNYYWFLYESYSSPYIMPGTANMIAADLATTYSDTVVYYGYFYMLGEELYYAINKERYTVTSYYYYLAKYYSYLYYWTPAYAEMLENYYNSYASDLYSQYTSYRNSVTDYYYEVSDYYYYIIFP